MKTNQQLPPDFCQEHEIPIRGYCHDCQIAICSDCALDHHRGHDCCSLKSMEQQEKEKMKKLLLAWRRQVQDTEATYNCSNEALDKAIGLVHDQTMRLSKQLDDEFELMISKLLEHKAKQMKKVRMFSNDLTKQLNIIADEKAILNSLFGEFRDVDNTPIMQLLDKKNVVGRDIQQHMRLFNQNLNVDISTIHKFGIGEEWRRGTLNEDSLSGPVTEVTEAIDSAWENVGVISQDISDVTYGTYSNPRKYPTSKSDNTFEELFQGMSVKNSNKKSSTSSFEFGGNTSGFNFGGGNTSGFNSSNPKPTKRNFNQK